jgi:hypothetical protein
MKAPRHFASHLALIFGLCSLFAGHRADAQAAPATLSSQPISVETSDGNLVCGSEAFSQVPGTRNLFVGRGGGIGSLEYCHTGMAPHPLFFLVLFRMDWARHKLIMQDYLLKAPDQDTGRDQCAIGLRSVCGQLQGRDMGCVRMRRAGRREQLHRPHGSQWKEP